MLFSTGWERVFYQPLEQDDKIPLNVYILGGLKLIIKTSAG